MDNYKRGFIPYALAALMIGLVGGFSAVLGPAFVQDMGLPYSSTVWTALAQAMSTAACAPVLGRLGDMLGRRRSMLLGIAVFTLGNVLSALADSLAAMLLARFIVGAGSAAITPAILAYIVTSFPGDRAARGFSLYMLISSASVVAGPISGGLIIAARGWRAMLWLCSAICMAVFALCLLLGREKKQPVRPLRGFDAPGAALAIVFFSLVLCLPSFGQNLGWRSPPFVAALAGAALSLIGLLLCERRARHPILPAAFIGRRAFILSVAALFFTQGLMQANMTNIIVFVNHTRPGSSAISGSSISAMYLGIALGSVLLGPLADRFEPKAVLSGSLSITALGCGSMLLFRPDAAAPLLLASLGLLGLGLGGNGTVFMKVVLSGLPAEEAASGTGTYGLFRDLAAPFGVAVFVPLFTNRISALSAGGLGEAEAAVRAMHSLALAELACIAAGLAAVLLLPKIHRKGEGT